MIPNSRERKKVLSATELMQPGALCLLAGSSGV